MRSGQVRSYQVRSGLVSSLVLGVLTFVAVLRGRVDGGGGVVARHTGGHHNGAHSDLTITSRQLESSGWENIFVLSLEIFQLEL